MALLFIFLINFSWAKEVDSFTGWYNPLQDGSEIVNFRVNTEIKLAVEEHNRDSKTCDPEKVMDLAYERLGGNPWGKLEMEFDKSTLIPKQEIRFEDSVYREFRFLDAPVQVLRIGCCSNVLSINGVRIGTDKIGHFFGQGMSYYTMINRKLSPLDILTFGYHIKKYGRNLNGALKWGYDTEMKGLYGQVTTGVGSFGDLAANYDGFRFWSSLTKGKYPFLICQKGKYKVSKLFDVKDYVSQAWDEAINCSAYPNSSVWQAMENSFSRLSQNHGNTTKFYHCPMVGKVCSNLRKKYGFVSNSVLSPVCK